MLYYDRAVQLTPYKIEYINKRIVHACLIKWNCCQSSQCQTSYETGSGLEVHQGGVKKTSSPT